MCRTWVGKRLLKGTHVRTSGESGLNISFELRTDIMEETLHGNIDLFP